MDQGGPLTTDPPPDDARFPLLRLGGTPREVGLAHGSLCASRIARVWALYARIFGAVGVTEDEMPAIGARFRLSNTDSASSSLSLLSPLSSSCFSLAARRRAVVCARAEPAQGRGVQRGRPGGGGRAAAS